MLTKRRHSLMLFQNYESLNLADTKLHQLAKRATTTRSLRTHWTRSRYRRGWSGPGLVPSGFLVNEPQISSPQTEACESGDQ